MAGDLGKRAKGAVETFIGAVVLAAMLLVIGWFVGFRPIEWVTDFVAAAYPGESTSPTATDSRPAPYVAPVESDPQAPPPPVPELWECYWDPTMNENWHDDVLCQKGFDYDRPLLLTDWSFVTQDDMMAAAADYEDWLNSR